MLTPKAARESWRWQGSGHSKDNSYSYRVSQGDTELFCVGRLLTHFYFTWQSQVVKAFIQTGVVIVHHEVHHTHERATSFLHPEFPLCAISPGSVYTSRKHGNAASAVT